jgi:hypothetical protein
MSSVEADGITMHRVREGTVAEHWSVTRARVLQQFCALPGSPD